MIDENLQTQIEQLCTQGKLERSDLGETESRLLTTLESLDIPVRVGDQLLEIDVPQELFSLERIQTELDDKAIVDAFDWHYQLQTESTNLDALASFDRLQKPCIVLAEMQTSGKGRRGRQWLSPFASNIYCTIGMPASIKAHNLGLISIVTGIAICKALSHQTQATIQLKWPNDLYNRKKKLGGILIESKPANDGSYYFAIGIGINVLMTAEQLEVIPQAATSLKLIRDGSVSRNQIAGAVIREVVEAVKAFDETAIPALIEEFNQHDAFRNQRIRVTTASQSIYGLNLGINSSGQLELETDQGREQFSAADISVRGID